jgi:acetyl esterase/lipase/lysophospholipase L1-like esterase
MSTITSAQQVVPLYPGKAPGSERWDWKEKEIYSDVLHNSVVYNVSEPSLTVFPAPPATANGTAVIICPGGAFHMLSINSEGTEVAKWLNAKGVTAFVLKYRLVKSETDDPVKEMFAKVQDMKKLDEENAPVIPLAIEDGTEAIRYVRSHAKDYGIDPKRIGVMGFSAGGTVTAGVTLKYKPETRPDFVAPIYPYMAVFKEIVVPADAPPMFIVAASDDQLGFAPHSTNLYDQWNAAGKPVELHMYMKGGHGFGMENQNLPTDSWIERFGEWLEMQGLFLPADPNHRLRKFTPQQLMEHKKQAEDRMKNDWAYLKRYAAENKKLAAPKAGESRVVFMGNSITEGWKRLDSAFFKGRPYVNRGISGQTTPQMLIRFRPDVLELQPKVVVILAGINDIAENTGPISLESTMGNIASMASLARANGVQVVLSSVLPAYDFPWRPGLAPAEKVVTLNKMLKKYANENNMIYLDYFSAMVDDRKGLKKELSGDGVHPNLKGYKIMEPLVEKAIEAALNRSK